MIIQYVCKTKLKGLVMEPKEIERRKKSKLIGWIVGIVAIIMYLIALYFGAGQG